MKKKRTILIIGGARSGKSRCALKLARAFKSKTLLATLEPKDKEMRARIQRHRQARGPGWRVVEEPLKLKQALEAALSESAAVVVDCITLWLSNLLLSGMSDDAIFSQAKNLCKLLNNPGAVVVLVSNEVGQGIVPAEPLARRYRDLLGEVNKMLAGVCSEVYLMVAGIPMVIKREQG